MRRIFTGRETKKILLALRQLESLGLITITLDKVFSDGPNFKVYYIAEDEHGLLGWIFEQRALFGIFKNYSISLLETNENCISTRELYAAGQRLP